MENLKDIITLLGVFIGTTLAVALGYGGKKVTAKPPDPVVSGVGMELGSRAQIDMLIEQVRRIGDILEGKKTQGIEAKMEEMLEQIDRLATRQTDLEGMRGATAPRRRSRQ